MRKHNFATDRVLYTQDHSLTKWRPNLPLVHVHAVYCTHYINLVDYVLQIGHSMCRCLLDFVGLGLIDNQPQGSVLSVSYSIQETYVFSVISSSLAKLKVT